MSNRTATVDAFVEVLDHPLKAEIVAVRAMILDSNDEITEQIKWNAPSFCYRGDDRVTMKLYPPRHLQLIFHRGAIVKVSRHFVFEDLSGLMKWASADRGVVTLRNMDDVTTHRAALVELVSRWMQATA